MVNIFDKFKMILSKNEQQKVEKIVLETKTEIPDDFEFNEEFQHAFNLMENTKEHIFITGKAGTGKSTLLQYFRVKTKKSIVVLAPTGVAAIKIRGQTIHSFFKFPPRFIQKDHIRRLRTRELLKKIDTIIIDEMSMLRADLLDGIDYALRINREQHDFPFGGVQIILFGDLFQLPPVVDRDIRGVMQKLYKSCYFFSANIIKGIKLKYVELHKIYRQKDENFIRLLNKIRVKQVDENDLKYLNERVNPSVTHESGIVTLTTTNSDANTINENCLAKITYKEFKYNAHICGKFDETSYPAEVCLMLKKGAQVMLIKNDRDKRWVNGTIAEIADLSEAHIEVRIEDNIYKVPKVSWEKIEYIYNPVEEKIEEKVIGSFEQYPLKLAWAITIHKSQGQTFKNLIIDMGFGAFTHGQTYVALSRCTSLEGIVLKRPIIYSDIIFDNRIYEFSSSCKNQLDSALPVKHKDEEIKARGPKYSKGQFIYLNGDQKKYIIRYVYENKDNGESEYRVSSDGAEKIVKENMIASSFKSRVSLGTVEGNVCCTFEGSTGANEECSYDISTSGKLATDLVLKINKWTYTKVRSRTAIRNLTVVSQNRLKLEISGGGYDNRCRWCKSFRTALETACNKEFGEGSFLQEGYCGPELRS